MNVTVTIFTTITRSSARALRGVLAPRRPRGARLHSGALAERRRQPAARPVRLPRATRVARGNQEPTRGLKCVTIKRGQRVNAPRAAAPRGG